MRKLVAAAGSGSKEMRPACFSASPTAAPRRRALLRPAISAGFFNLTLDPDHGKDDNRSPWRLGGVIDS
jgi:hypothetical protein